MTTSSLARPPGMSSIRAERGTVHIDVFGEIDPTFGVSALEVFRLLKANPGAPVQVAVSSPGGDAFEGLAIYEALRNHVGRVTVNVVGLAASAASVIAMAGDEIVIAPTGTIFVHDALTWTAGNEADHLAAAELLGMVSDSIAAIYAARAGGAVADWRAVMRREGWFSAEEAVAAGLADRIAEPAEPSTVGARAARRSAVKAHAPTLSQHIRAAVSSGLYRPPARVRARQLPPTAIGAIRALRTAGARPRGVLR